MSQPPFPLRFAGQLRPSQKDAVSAAAKALGEGRRQVYIVAPPGSGKTVLALYLWAEHVRLPAVVLAPNSAIQSQWASHRNLLATDPAAPDPISTDPEAPGWLTSLTYQSATLPRQGEEDLDAQAIALWHERLIEKCQARDPREARIWVDDLRHRNPDYYDRRLAAFRKEVRDRIAQGGEALKVLHRSSLATLQRLKERGAGLMILDECHHLLGHWGRVLAEVHEMLDRPMVIGLTATPPDREGRLPEDLQRYDDFLGPVVYDTPLPAVVKDGFLAPYQDLAYLVRPSGEELSYLANVDRQFAKLVTELCRPAEPELAGTDSSEAHSSEGQSADAAAEGPPGVEPLPQWLVRVLAERRLPTGPVKDWASFEHRDAEFALAARLFLQRRGIALPPEVPPLAAQEALARPEVQILVPVLDRYVRHGLMRSALPADHDRAEQAIAQLRLLGVQVSETGPRACASPVDRVLAYSRAKAQSLLPVLKAESRVLGDRIRAVIVADYEKTSAVTPEIEHLLDEEAGGAVAAFRALLSDPETDALDPVLVTGSTVLVDDDLAPRFLQCALEWLEARKLDLKLSYVPQAGFNVLVGEGEAWCPRVYVGMITALFEQGVTRCLVGTRGLLGEGWDAQRVNVLVSLAAITTSMSVNQLYGRSIRLDPADPHKLADNWEIVCLAPEFTQGLADYHRFMARHKTLYGLTDDGAIEKGVGHVHAAFTELKPEVVEGSVEVLNAEMLARPGRRAEFRALWRIGQPYSPDPIHALEVRDLGFESGGGFPPFAGARDPWSSRSLALAVGQAVLASLADAGLMAKPYQLRGSDRAGGYVRLFIENAGEEDGALFARSLQEALGPLDHPRYVIPRYADEIRDTWLSRILPEILARYLQKRHRRLAVLHAVPSAMARNKDVVAIYQRHWNRYVSPGDALYAYQGEGARLLEEAQRTGCVPQSGIREKQIFL
jgi:superfamily II DNA or RNA helicase